MAEKYLPSVEILRQLLNADFTTGKLYWRKRSPDMFENGKRDPKHLCAVWNARYAGKEALAANHNSGYRAGSILSRTCLAHRVIWAMHTGTFPDNIDHINGDRKDNRIINLRSVSKRENALNKAMQSNNTSGCVGVVFVRHLNKWQSKIKINGKYISLGCFCNFDDAAKARKAAEKKYFFHPNHGRSV